MIHIRRATPEDGRVISHLLRARYHFTDDREAANIYDVECATQHYRIAEIGEA